MRLCGIVGHPRLCWTLPGSADLEVSSQARLRRYREGVAILWDVLIVESRVYGGTFHKALKTVAWMGYIMGALTMLCRINHMDKTDNRMRNYTTLTGQV